MEKEIKEAEKHFFFPQNRETFLQQLDQAVAGAPQAVVSLADSFKSNLGAVLSTLSMPVQMAEAHIWMSRFMQIHSRERRRAVNIDRLVDAFRGKRKYDGLTDEEEQAALKSAERIMTEVERTPERAEARGRSVRHLLGTLVSEDEIECGARELMRQGVVLVWSAFEVLAQDLFVTVVNKSPGLAVRLSEVEATKQYFRQKAFSVETLSKYDYDLSQRMGVVLSEFVRLDDIRTMKSVFGVLFPNVSILNTALAPRELWILNQRRNLILHRRSVVDSEYISKTEEQVSVGSELIVTPDETRRYMEVTRDAGIALLTASIPELR